MNVSAECENILRRSQSSMYLYGYILFFNKPLSNIYVCGLEARSADCREVVAIQREYGQYR